MKFQPSCPQRWHFELILTLQFVTPSELGEIRGALFTDPNSCQHYWSTKNTKKLLAWISWHWQPQGGFSPLSSHAKEKNGDDLPKETSHLINPPMGPLGEAASDSTLGSTLGNTTGPQESQILQVSCLVTDCCLHQTPPSKQPHKWLAGSVLWFL